MNIAINASPAIVAAVAEYARIVEKRYGLTRCPEIRHQWIESTIAWAQMIYEAKGAMRVEAALFDQLTNGHYCTGEYIPYDNCPHWQAEIAARKIKNAEIRARMEAQ